MVGVLIPRAWQIRLEEAFQILIHGFRRLVWVNSRFLDSVDLRKCASFIHSVFFFFAKVK